MRSRRSMLRPSACFALEPDPLPMGIRRMLQIPGKIRELLDFRGRAPPVRRCNARYGRRRTEELVGPPVPRNRGSNHLAIADELRGKPGRAAALAGGATEDERIPAIFDNGVRITMPVGAGDLRDRLEAKDTTATKFAQPRERVLQSVDLSQRIQFVHDEPRAPASLSARLGGGLGLTSMASNIASRIHPEIGERRRGNLAAL